MGIAEFVPEVSQLARLAVGPLQVTWAAHLCVDWRVGGSLAGPGSRDLFEQRQVTRMRFVESGDQAAHRTHRPLWCDHETGPTLSGKRRAPLIRDRLEGTHNCRPDGHDMSPGVSRRVDALGCVTGHAVVSSYGGS